MKTILIVDDDPMFLRMYEANLAFYKKQIQVLTASSGAEGLEKIRQSPPDLVVVDYKMPGMDGGEFCRRLRADPKTQSIPLVLVSSSAEKDVSPNLPNELFVSKPITDVKIRVILQKFFGM